VGIGQEKEERRQNGHWMHVEPRCDACIKEDQRAIVEKTMPDESEHCRSDGDRGDEGASGKRHAAFYDE
jgi:hypothetical protein